MYSIFEYPAITIFSLLMSIIELIFVSLITRVQSKLRMIQRFLYFDI
jgi:hypothetical protein